jgi:lipopolysaccharide/colanic/teichoic acid biosynthesis glycosyltransferase
MKVKNQALPLNLYKRTGMFLFLLALAIFFEPAFIDKLTFAVTYFDGPRGAFQTDKSGYAPAQNIPYAPLQHKSHAPEPGTFLLILGGIGGMIVRFARGSFERFKRISDIVISIAGLTITSPILIFAAILIKLNSRGPVIYKQNRVGRNYKIFEVYKLRTMRLDAEKGIGAVWARENDPRVTPVGKILRKTHIDEIPQLFNVLKGQMSIVGPRPERPEMVRDLRTLIIDYEKRLEVLPGITGLAQIYYKYDETIEDVKKKIKYDLLYIKKMCWLTEMRILARTFLVVLTAGRGAR